MAHFAANIPWDLVLLFLLLGAVIPWRGAVRIRKLLAKPSLSQAERIGTYASTIAFQWLLTAIVAWRCVAHHYVPRELGLVVENKILTAIVAILFATFFGFLQSFAARRMATLPDPAKSRIAALALRLMPETAIESLVFIALCVTAGLCEEFLYRGFVFAAIARAAGIPLALIGSSAMFSLAHIYQGRRGLITTFILGVLFAVSRIWTGNLIPAIAAHAVVDLVAGLVAVRYLRRAIANAALRDAEPVAEAIARS
jgi:uncharacterized protein